MITEGISRALADLRAAGCDADADRIESALTPKPAPDNRAEWSLHDRVEFALRDAGFDYDEAFAIASIAAARNPS